MSANCLVTKLKTAVENSNLEVLGELVLNVKAVSSSNYENANVKTIILKVNDTVKVTVEGDGLIGTDVNDITHTSLTLSQSLNVRNVYMSNGTYKLHFSNKYAFVYINLPEKDYTCGNMASIPDISKLKYNDGLEWLANGFSDSAGDISELSGLASTFKTCRFNNVKGITGDITDFSFTDARLQGTKVYGDFTSILSSVTGTMSYLKSIFKGQTGVTKRDGELSADISQAVAELDFLSAAQLEQKIACRWTTTRAASSKIIAFERVSGDYGFDFGNYLDAMLVNQANCTAVSGATGANATIDVLGNRTSVSDSAVATLKTMGYTIKVNGVTL